jgi:hypothetical protein
MTDKLTAAAREQAELKTALHELDQTVTALAARIADILPGPDGTSASYKPRPAPKWWALHGPARDTETARLRAWVDQVYRPGYGHLAARLAPCAFDHELCLYALDIAAELHAVLYVQPNRSTALLSAQAEYTSRILPALADLIATETRTCQHSTMFTLNGRRP